MIFCKGRLLKKSLNRKSKLVLSTLVTTWLLNIAFHLRSIWLQTLVAIDSQSCLPSFPRFCAPPSEVAVLFDLNLSRRPFLGQVVDSDLLLCTGFDSEHAFCSYAYFYSETNKWLKDWAKRWARPWLASTSRNSIEISTKVTRCGPKFTKHQNLVDSWTESVSQEW